jgi:AcrR family transcriptional regulator
MAAKIRRKGVSRYSGRDLDRAMIVEAARQLLREFGVAGLSMRRLAFELGVSATALYYHVSNKDDLLDEVVTGLLRSAGAVSDSLTWPEALEELLVRLQYIGSEYPGILHFLSQRLQSDGTLLWMELQLRVLKRGGLSDEHASAALTILSFYNSAQPLREHTPTRTGPWSVMQPDELSARVAKHRHDYPTLAGILTHVRQPDEQLYRQGLKALIAGFKAQIGQASVKQADQPIETDAVYPS